MLLELDSTLKNVTKSEFELHFCSISFSEILGIHFVSAGRNRVLNGSDWI